MQVGNSWTLGKIAGIPVRLNLSVALLAAYVVYTFFSIQVPVFSLLVGVYVVGVFLISILLHELAHSFTAIAFGGRIREITLQLLGGCALITRMPALPWQECLMAFAGPLCSLILAGCAWFGAMVFGGFGEVWTPQGVVAEFYPNLWFILAATLNFGLAIFNLLPAFPMDGGRILRSLLQCVGKSKVRATEIAVWGGRGFAVLWVFSALLDLLFGVTISSPTWAPHWLAYLQKKYKTSAYENENDCEIRNNSFCTSICFGSGVLCFHASGHDRP